MLENNLLLRHFKSKHYLLPKKEVMPGYLQSVTSGMLIRPKYSVSPSNCIVVALKHKSTTC